MDKNDLETREHNTVVAILDADLKGEGPNERPELAAEVEALVTEDPAFESRLQVSELIGQDIGGLATDTAAPYGQTEATAAWDDGCDDDLDDEG